MNLNLSEEHKQVVNEISALSGLQKAVVREVWEFTLIHWAEKLSKALEDNPKALVKLEIPFLGNVSVQYDGDLVTDKGTILTEVKAFVGLDPSFKKLVGDTVDEGDSLVLELLDKKLDNALISINLEK